MKTLKVVQDKIYNILNSSYDVSEDKSMRKQISQLRLQEKYLITNPSEGYVLSEIIRLESFINSNKFIPNNKMTVAETNKLRVSFE